MIENKLKLHLLKHSQSGLHRKREVFLSNLINFSSNDYLSLSEHPEVRNFYKEGFEIYPSGSGASMVICGYHNIHQEFEREFAKALNVDTCLLFSSGYSANLALTSFLGKLGLNIIIDKGVHASIYDGLKLAGANYGRYLHNNLKSLENTLKSIERDTVIITESLFSMSGQFTDLAKTYAVAKKKNASVLVDEAHAFGIVGENGLGGIVEDKLTQNEIPLRVIPLGKAFCASGAIIAGKAIWIDALLQHARSYIYSTAISPAFTYGLLCTLKFIQKANDRRKHLFDLIEHFRSLIKISNLTWRDSHSPIQQLQLGCPFKAQEFSKRLLEQGILCLPIRQPTVTKQETGLRIVLNYRHTKDDLNNLFNYFSDKS